MRRGLASFRIGAFKKGWMMESDGKSSARKKRKLDQDLDATAAAIAEIRAARRMTLADLGQRSGVAASTISRIENRQTSPTFAVLQKIAAGLSVPVSSLLSKPRDRFAGGRRSVIRAGEGTPLQAPHGRYQLLAEEIATKEMAPALLYVPPGPPMMGGHPGEEFFMVIRGSIHFHMEYYAPLLMKEGDSVYFDAGTPHAVTSATDEEAVILSIVSLARRIELDEDTAPSGDDS